MIEGLVDHLERYLGEISGGWTEAPDGTPMPFQVVEYVPTVEHTIIYSTLGLSEHVLDSPHTDEKYRLEAMMMVPAKLRGGPIPGILLEIGRLLIEAREMPSVGSLFRNVAPLREVSTMDTLYFGRPLFYPPEFAAFPSDDIGVNIGWLLPVSDAEADFVEREGWEAFERLMRQREDVDPIDLDRGSLV
jgi:hypothetical protein